MPTNNEIITHYGLKIIDNNALSIASYLEEEEITRKRSTIIAMLNEARADERKKLITDAVEKAIIDGNQDGTRKKILRELFAELDKKIRPHMACGCEMIEKEDYELIRKRFLGE